MPESELKNRIPMIKINNIIKWFKELSPQLKGYVIIIILLTIGIILRWNVIISNIIKGFDYFSK